MLIAEIGNQHFGDLDHAKELIKSAHESGADLVKSQAFCADDIKQIGSMPFDFYKTLEFTFAEYVELIEYAKSIGCVFFYSIFSPKLWPLKNHQQWHKIAGSQVKNHSYSLVEKDHENVIVSVPKNVTYPVLRRAKILYVSDYLPKDPELDCITRYSDYYKRQVGYSDHTIGIGACVEAIEMYGVHDIEKHFTIKKDFKFRGQTYRDCIHSVTPKEFEALTKIYRNLKGGGIH